MITTSCYYCGITNILTWHFQLCWYTVKEVMIIAHCIELHQMVAYEWTVSVNNGEWCAACGVRILRVAMFGDEFTNCFALSLKISLYWKQCLIVISHGCVQVSRHCGLSHSGSEPQLAMGPWIWSYPCSVTLFTSDLFLICFRQCWWLWPVTECPRKLQH